MSNRAAHASAFRALLSRPGPTFPQTLARAIDAGELPLEVVKRLLPFPERVADLSPEEMQELHDETFGQVDDARHVDREGLHPRRPAFLDAPSAGALGAAKARILELLSDWEVESPERAGAVVHELCSLADRLDTALAAARNPYGYVFASLAVLLRSSGA